jgi:hypothetical protein
VSASPPTPAPPADIAARTPLQATIAPGAELHRFFTRARFLRKSTDQPIYFDTSDTGRFNAPDGSYGTLYAAENPRGAFAETFLREHGRTLIAPDQIARKGYVRLRTRRSLRLVMLHRPGLAAIGATADVTNCGLRYTIPQQWSAALFAHRTRPDGIQYRSRHDNDEICYAFFDRAAAKIEEVQRETNLDQDWFYELFDPYQVSLAP